MRKINEKRRGMQLERRDNIGYLFEHKNGK